MSLLVVCVVPRVNLRAILMSEFDWISQYLSPLSSDGSFNLLDDAALIPTGSHSHFIITQDTIIENIHFLSDIPVSLVAQKALRVNLSDIIAKGGRALHYSLSLGVPSRWTDSDMSAFADGLRQDQELFSLSLTGGDTYSSPENLCISITMLAHPHISNRYISRSGASPDDILCVTGTIGDAALGLRVARGELTPNSDSDKSHFLQSYHCPSFCDISLPIATHATSALDISDGLLGDCRKLCDASGVTAIFDTTDIPLSSPTRALLDADSSLLDTILTGGDDYHILCTVPSTALNDFTTSVADIGGCVYPIGKIVESTTSSLAVTCDGVPWSTPTESYIHF